TPGAQAAAANLDRAHTGRSRTRGALCGPDDFRGPAAVARRLEKSLRRNSNAAFETGLLDGFLNDPGPFRLRENLSQYALRSVRSSFRNRYRYANRIERTGHDPRAGIRACNRVDEARIRAKHVCLAIAQHFNGVLGEVWTQWQPHQLG